MKRISITLATIQYVILILGCFFRSAISFGGFIVGGTHKTAGGRRMTTTTTPAAAAQGLGISVRRRIIANTYHCSLSPLSSTSYSSLSLLRDKKKQVDANRALSLSPTSLWARSYDDDSSNEEGNKDENDDGDGEEGRRGNRKGENRESIGKKRKRDQLRDFFVSSGSSSSSSARTGSRGGSEPVRPFDVSGKDVIPPNTPPEGTRTPYYRPKFDSFFGDGQMPGLEDILGMASKGEDMDDYSFSESGMTGSSSVTRGDYYDVGSYDDDDDDDNYDNGGGGRDGGYDDDDDYYIYDTYEDGYHPDDVRSADESFASFMDDMSRRIAEQRKYDPESVPNNAERFLESVVSEMRMAKLVELQRERRNAEMREYERRKLDEMEGRVRESRMRGEGVGGVVEDDPVVREVLGEAKASAEAKAKYEGKVKDFREYERRKVEELESASASALAAGREGEGASTGDDPIDPDEQALKLMQNLLARRTAEEEAFERRLAEQAGEDGEYDILEWDTDNLEDGIEELKRIIAAKKGVEAKGQAQGVTRPETMKEWQMYRSIASKMSESGESAVMDEANAVADKLRAWKEFQAKEEEMRRATGLTKGARMPFPWSDREDSPGVGSVDSANNISSNNKIKNNKDPSTAGGGASGSARETDPDRVRLEYDRTALQVLRDLADSTYDEYRAGKLREEIAELEIEIKELEEKIRNKPPPSQVRQEKKTVAPVDVSDIFGAGSIFGEEADLPANVGWKEESEPVPPPSTPLFSDSFEEDAYIDEKLPSVPPPDTPFFRGDSSAGSIGRLEGVEETDEEEDDDDDKEEIESLGSIEEQKIRSMARRSGIRSKAEEEKLRKEWEEFQKFERSRRDRAGLSGDAEDPNLRAGTKMKYDIDEVVKGGDVDAEKILDSIGERPSKKRRKKENAASATGSDVAVPAEEGSYEQFLRYENERMEQLAQEQDRLRQEAQDGENSVGEDVDPSQVGGDDDDDDEKEDVIVYQKHATKWDKASVTDQLYRSLALRGNYARGEEGGNEVDRAAFEEYLRKEEAMRRAIESGDIPDAVVEGDVVPSLEELDSVEALEDYAEDVLDELGPRPTPRRARREDFPRDYSSGELSDSRNVAGSTEYDDDRDATRSMRGKTFGKTLSTSSDQLPDWVRREQEERRREEFLKDDDDDDSNDDDYTTDYEDDLDDLDYEAKQRQAEEFERRTSGGRPREVSLGDIFGRDYFGPDDEPDDYYSLTKGRGGRDDSFSSFQRRKKDLLDYSELSVAELNSLMDYRDEDTGGASRYMKKVRKPYREFGAIFRLEQLLVDVTGLNREAWKRTAEKHGYDMPELEDIRIAAAHRAEFAVQRIFYWTDDFMEGREVARTQRAMVTEVFGEWMKEEGIDYEPTEKAKQPGSFDIDLGLGVAANAEEVVGTVLESTSEADEDSASNNIAPDTESDTDAYITPSEAEFLSMQLEAWTKAAERFDLQRPTEKDVAATAFVSPEDTVMKLFQWTDDTMKCDEIVLSFRASLKEATDRWAAQHNPETLAKTMAKDDKPDQGDTEKADKGATDAISEEDLLEMQLFAWTAAAEALGFDSPSLENVQLASWVSPDEAVRRVFKWSNEDEAVTKTVESQKKAMKKITAIYIKKKNIKIQKADTSDDASGQGQSVSAPTEEDILKLQLDVWTETAKHYSFNPPNVDEVQLATFGSPDEAVIRVFKWTNDGGKSREVAATFREIMGRMSKEFLQRFNQGVQPGTEVNVAKQAEGNDEVILPMYALKDGAIEWLQTLQEVEMPCALLSHLDRREVDVILERTGLAKFFPADRRVTVANQYRGEMNELLGAALRLERRPDHCVVFDVTPNSAVAAHENGMQCVAMIGLYANYDLLAADMTAKYFDQFRTQNLRGLFSDVKLDEPQEELQQSLPVAPKPLQTRFWEEGDRS